MSGVWLLLYFGPFRCSSVTAAEAKPKKTATGRRLASLNAKKHQKTDRTQHVFFPSHGQHFKGYISVPLLIRKRLFFI